MVAQSPEPGAHGKNARLLINALTQCNFHSHWKMLLLWKKYLQWLINCMFFSASLNQRCLVACHFMLNFLFLVHFRDSFLVPWSQRLSFNIIFFHLEICDAKCWSKRRAGRRRKPLVATVENLTFMLAQHLTAVKDAIFFWPITKGDRIYNLLTGPGGSVLRYSEINYFVGRGEKHLQCLQAVKLPGSCFHS